MQKWMAGMAGIALLAAGSPAAVIGLNFTDGWPTPMLSGGETADGFSNWTDSIGNMGGGDPTAQTGTVVLAGSSVIAKWDASNTWAGGNENTSEQQLYRVYLDDGDGGNSLVSNDGIGVSVTLFGLSSWLLANGGASYAIRAYSSTDNDNATFLPVSIRMGAPNPADGANQLLNLPILETLTVPTLGPGDFPPNTTPDPTWGMWQSRGYGDSSSNLSADVVTLTIPIKVVGAPIRGTLAGFQITSVVPEPGTGLLLAGGLGALLALRRRRAA